MKVMKFGGSSLADAAAIKKVVDIISVEYAEHKSDIIVVLSAMGGVTNMLIQAATHAKDGSRTYEDYLSGVRDTHARVIDALFTANNTARESVRKAVDELLAALSQLLYGIMLVQECSPVSFACVSGFGEQLSCILMSHYLSVQNIPARYVDARSMITISTETETVDTNNTYAAIRKELLDRKQIPVVTGFIARTDKGKDTTLGRNGSDYTASLIGAAMSAKQVEIWTDVDGFYSADPRFVHSSFVLPEVSIQEAMELANCGASVVHPYTIIPLIESVIPVYVRNTFNPTHKGTLIFHGAIEHKHAITGLASIESVAIINIEGNRMIGSRGIAARIFTALSHAGVNIMMISQAASEHSICIVCKEKDMSAALEEMRRELDVDIRAQRINYLTPIYDLELVAIVGANMRGHSGIAGKLFAALGNAGVNILAIAQGSSEMNISFVIHTSDRDRALNVIHEAFFANAATANADDAKQGS